METVERWGWGRTAETWGGWQKAFSQTEKKTKTTAVEEAMEGTNPRMEVITLTPPNKQTSVLTWSLTSGLTLSNVSGSQGWKPVQSQEQSNNPVRQELTVFKPKGKNVLIPTHTTAPRWGLIRNTAYRDQNKSIFSAWLIHSSGVIMTECQRAFLCV